MGRLCCIATVLLLALDVFALPWTVPTQTVMVKMSDGTPLATDYYLPGEGGPSWPVLVARTTYPKGMAMTRVNAFLKAGYAAVVQDTRGLGYSKGMRNVFYTDGWREGLHDGKDTIAWVKSQPWCNGKIATFGESALGITQVLLAPTTADVACQFIEVAPSNFYHNMAFQGGVWHKNLAEGWLALLGLADTIPMYKEGHPCYDEFWTYYNAEAKAPEIHLPAMHVAGWFDIFQQGSINNFVTRQDHGGAGAKGNQKLIIKAAAHMGYDSRDYKFKSNVHELSIGKLRDAFLAYWLTGEQNGIMNPPAVWYYTLGDDTDPQAPGNEWRTADTWPPFPTRETPYFLVPDGLLAAEPGTAPATASFTYDPANPFPTYGGANLLMATGPFDQRKVNKGRTDLIQFASAPLTAPIEVTGQCKVKLYVSTDAPDTDFTAKLVDVYPAGDDREILMIDAIQRVKLRNGFEKPAPLLTSADEVVEITVDLWSTSWVFNTRHRIGLQVSSSNYPRFDKNPNSGDNYPREDNLRIAHNTVHMGKTRPSALVLPVKP
jgi:hypothetical protein